MLKKTIAFQRLFSASIQFPSDMKRFFMSSFAWGILMGFFLLRLFVGNTLTSQTFLPSIIVVFTIWLINWNINNENRFFMLVPVSRSFTVLNIYLSALLFAVITYVIALIMVMSFLGVILGIVYLAQGSTETPPGFSPPQVIDTAKGSWLMLQTVTIALFTGTTIAFIRKNSLRNIAYIAIFILSYGLLARLKVNMPISPSTGRVEFLESFSIMPGADQILAILWLVIAILVPLSIYLGYKLYTSPSRVIK